MTYIIHVITRGETQLKPAAKERGWQTPSDRLPTLSPQELRDELLGGFLGMALLCAGISAALKFF